MQRIFVKNARRFMEEVVFELICTCNIDILVVARSGVVELPKKYAGQKLDELDNRLCRLCLAVDHGETQYLIKFYTLKTPLEKIVELLELAKREKGYSRYWNSSSPSLFNVSYVGFPSTQPLSL